MKKIMTALLLAAIFIVTSMASANYPSQGGILGDDYSIGTINSENLFFLPIVMSEYYQFSCFSVSGIPQIECEALVAFYNSTNGNEWHNNTEWLQTKFPCLWYGVSCGLTPGQVSSLNLNDNRLTGSLPSELGNLLNLRGLSLANNQLTGFIPDELSNLSSVNSLYLNKNKLAGPIPDCLRNLTYLDNLYLNENDPSLCVSTPELLVFISTIPNYEGPTWICVE